MKSFQKTRARIITKLFSVHFADKQYFDLVIISLTKICIYICN
jgi:hypothetical protein